MCVVQNIDCFMLSVGIQNKKKNHWIRKKANRWIKSILAAKFLAKVGKTNKNKKDQSKLENEFKRAEETANLKWSGISQIQSDCLRNNDAVRVFNECADRDKEDSGEQFLDPRRLMAAFSMLGLSESLVQYFPSKKRLNLEEFKSMIQSAHRTKHISTIINSVSFGLAQHLEPYFPAKIRDTTESQLKSMLSSSEFTALAASDILKYLKDDGGTETLKSSKDISSSSGEVDLSAVMNKYRDSGGWFGEFGDSQVLKAGLESRIGLPDPRIFKAILREHMDSHDSETPFETTNYNIVTTPMHEFALQIGNPKEYINEEGKREECPVCLQDIAKNEPTRGPSSAELMELKTEFEKLRCEFKIVSEKAPGMVGCSYIETRIMCSVKGLGIEVLDSKEQLESLLLHQLPETNFFKDANNKEPARRISKFSPATLGCDGSTSIVVSFPFEVDGKRIEEFRVLVGEYLKIPVHNVIAINEGKFKHLYDEDIKTANVDQTIKKVRRQARKLRSLKELMEIDMVNKAKLRVEEAIVVYQYTGPLFQVYDWT
jgi:hypothetical protein